jgi:tetratricopeptide (TPR) repeat protein
MSVAAIVILIALGLGVLLWQARDNYLAGKRALEAGAYSVAIERLNAAKVVGVGYADSNALLAHAVTLSQQATEYASLLRGGGSRPTAATRHLSRAAQLFATGDYAQAMALVPAGLSGRFPPEVLALRASARSSAIVSLLLLVQAQHAFAAGGWQAAAARAHDVLARDPRCTLAENLAARADRRALAEPYVTHARALAGAGHWLLAQSAVRQALRIDPTYPGAAALLAHITASIPKKKPKPAATATPTPTVTAPAAPPPPAPAPAPKPPAPPPPP